MNVRSIVKKYLEQHGYVGLRSYFGDCTCHLGDLMTHCEALVNICRPYRSNTSQPEGKPLIVEEIVKQYLEANNYIGLYGKSPGQENCQCGLSSLMVCYEPYSVECKPRKNELAEAVIKFLKGDPRWKGKNK